MMLPLYTLILTECLASMAFSFASLAHAHAMAMLMQEQHQCMTV